MILCRRVEMGMPNLRGLTTIVGSVTRAEAWSSENVIQMFRPTLDDRYALSANAQRKGK